MYLHTGIGPEDLISALISFNSAECSVTACFLEMNLTNGLYGLRRTAPHCKYNKYDADDKHGDRQQHAHG